MVLHGIAVFQLFLLLININNLTLTVPTITFRRDQKKKVSKAEIHRTKRKSPSVLYNILLFKPYGVICQFSDTEGKQTLADFGPFPNDVYPAGRLDSDSEGLILLTNDGDLQHSLLEPKFEHPRTYLVQVEHIPTEEGLQKLREGVIIEGIKTLPAEVELLEKEPRLPERPVPIRFRKTVPTAWLQIVLREGRNRQVRKMTAAIGHPALRLVRYAIANLTIDGLQPGEHRDVTEPELRFLQRILGQKNTKQRNQQRRSF